MVGTLQGVMEKHDDDLGVGLEKKTYDIEPEEIPGYEHHGTMLTSKDHRDKIMALVKKDLPKFDADKPTVCPKCGSVGGEDAHGIIHSWWMDSDGIFHWTCWDCEHEWLAVAEDKKK
jgi:hypothetical protein